LRSNLCLWGEPEAYSGKGRPKKHGSKFKLNEPTTWSEAASVFEVDDPKLHRVRVSLWKNLHFRKAAARPMSLIRFERLDQQETSCMNDKQVCQLAEEELHNGVDAWQK
jgi:hypothetical protein